MKLISQQTPDPDLEPTKFNQMNTITAGVYTGIFNPFFLPNDLYAYYFTNVYGAVGLGYGYADNFLPESARWKSALNYRANIESFSGCKTWQQVDLLSKNVFNPDGTKRPFSQFKKIAKGINEDYNINWLKTEQNAAFRVAQSAEDWHQIQENKDILPWLQYQTVGDDRVRPAHKAWDGVTRRIDDDFWSTRMPPNDWSCRCIVVQLESGVKTPIRGLPKNKSKVFANNPGKSGTIFPKTGHPYFNVPNDFKSAKNNNFGFVTPSDEFLKHKTK